MLPNDWRWWRRLIGGRWAPTRGLIWGRCWVKAGYGYELFGEHEDWARGGWHAPFDWLENKWIPVYCRFAWFHLMRAESDGHFIIVYQRKGLDPNNGPRVEGYRISSSSWTPRGCQNAAKGDVFWDNLMGALDKECGGQEGRRAFVRGLGNFKKGPQDHA